MVFCSTRKQVTQLPNGKGIQRLLKSTSDINFHTPHYNTFINRIKYMAVFFVCRDRRLAGECGRCILLGQKRWKVGAGVPTFSGE